MRNILPAHPDQIKRFLLSPQTMIYLLLLLMLTAAAIISPGYLQFTHLAGILRLASFLGIAAIGQNLAILSGGIDLSIAQLMCMGNVFGAQIMMAKNEKMLPALLVVAVLGALFGAFNGFGIKYLKIPAFIMTLGTSCIVQGVCLIYTKGAPKGNTAPLLKSICNDRLFNVLPPLVLLWLGLAILTIVVLKCTPFGRRIYAVGANETAARFSGVNTRSSLPFISFLPCAPPWRAICWWAIPAPATWTPASATIPNPSPPLSSAEPPCRAAAETTWAPLPAPSHLWCWRIFW